MSNPMDLQDTIAAEAPALVFERKITLSIFMTPRTYYAAVDIAAGIPYVQLLPEASKAAVFALYRVSNAAKPDTYMLQYAPASNELYGGNLLALTASAGRAFLS